MRKLLLLCVFTILYFQIGFTQQINDSTVKSKNPKEILCCGDKEGYFTKLENPATFPGGFDGWKNYVERNVHYPSKAKKKKIEGVVLVFLIIDTLGKVTNVRVLNNSERKLDIKNSNNFIILDESGKVIQKEAKLPANNPGFGLEQEAERLVLESPKWIPAEQNGKRVSYRLVQKVAFVLQ